MTTNYEAILEKDVAQLEDKVSGLESDVIAAGDLLLEACDRGLIYWEPNTERGAAKKADMLARIDRWLTDHGYPRV